jgi:hypothetical protein
MPMVVALSMIHMRISTSQTISKTAGRGTPEECLGDGISGPIGIPTTLTSLLAALSAP